MKVLVMILTMMGASGHKIKNDFTRQETKFIKNVVKMHWAERPTSITRTDSGNIAVEYSTTAYILGKNGFVSQVWILEDQAWINIGPEY